MKELWVEKYRPNTIEDYVFSDDKQRRQVERWIKEGTIPHLLFSGSAGIGKTTLAKMLLHQLEIPDVDILEINASRERGIDEVRNRITNFIQLTPWGPFKVVLLDEADFLTPPAQASLRGVMEEYHETARFILTCNYPNKVIPALHSRTQGFHFDKLDINEFTARVATILVAENIDFDLDILDNYVRLKYPDMRKCINLIQQNCIDGKLAQTDSGDNGQSEWRFDMINMFKSGNINGARKLICSKAIADEMEEIYRWIYDNLDAIYSDEEDQQSAILIIKQGLADHTLVGDPEINMSATLVKLARLARK
jgi:replication factor C small subunit